MRITHLCLGCFYADGFSYQENLLPKYHLKQGHEVRVIASLQSYNTDGKQIYLPEATKYVNEYGITVTRLDYRFPAELNKKLKKYCGLYNALEECRPEILFIHGCQFADVGVVVKYLKKHSDVRVYVDNHADFHNSAGNWVSKNILHGILWRSCAQMLDPFVAKWYGVLPARVDFLKSEYKLPENKIELLVMGADDEKVSAALNSGARERIREKYGISDDDFLIMTGGKISHGKRRTINLMEAVNRIGHEHVKLIVFGSVIDEYMPLVQQQLSDKVQYIGWVNSDESSDYFSAADLVVFPGLHSVFWEQVAGLGIPMICTRLEGTDHVDLGGNVIFISSDDDSQLYEAIERVLDGGIYESMKKTAIEKGIPFFSYNLIAERSIEEKK